MDSDTSNPPTIHITSFSLVDYIPHPPTQWKNPLIYRMNFLTLPLTDGPVNKPCGIIIYFDIILTFNILTRSPAGQCWKQVTRLAEEGRFSTGVITPIEIGFGQHLR